MPLIRHATLLPLRCDAAPRHAAAAADSYDTLMLPCRHIFATMLMLMPLNVNGEMPVADAFFLMLCFRFIAAASRFRVIDTRYATP